MKRLFLGIVLFLSAGSVFTWWIQPAQRSSRPLLYWVTTTSPVRDEELASFEAWLEERGYPDMELRVDAANNDASKKLIQGISGVGADLLDNYADQTYLMQSTGILADLTEAAEAYGFGPASTYPAIRDNFMIEGRQWGYPASVSVALLIVNVAAFEAAGMEVPPRVWDIETFEEWGKRYVAARREPGQRQRHFFASSVERYELFRSLGLSVYNETMSACVLNDARYIRVLEKVKQWIEEDHILPGPQEESTFAVEGSGMGVTLALFARGTYAMLNMGRFAMVRLRQYPEQEYSASLMPHFEYPNTRVAGGTIGLYAKSRYKEEAYRFFEYLASERHNAMVVENGSGLPVRPELLESENFLRPAAHPNEWGVHGAFAEAMQQYSISRSSSPFVLPDIARRIEVDVYRAFIAGRLTAAEAAALVTERINKEMELTIRDQPALLTEYEHRVAIQEQVDAVKARGEPIPEEWIYNPFHRRYYADTGMLEIKGDME
jgi:ABC-type glycerol-3-phosphate transport system substrate-binding protein